MLTNRLKILPADKAFKKIITKDQQTTYFELTYKGWKVYVVYENGKKQYKAYDIPGSEPIIANSIFDIKREIDKAPESRSPEWRNRDANPDLINMYKQKFEEAIDNGDKEEMKRWFREIMNHVSFTDAEFQSIGKHNDTPDDQFDAEELAKGIKVEMEHTDDKEMAKSIAKDHLAEIPDYYTRLLKMEAEAKQ